MPYIDKYTISGGSPEIITFKGELVSTVTYAGNTVWQRYGRLDYTSGSGGYTPATTELYWEKSSNAFASGGGLGGGANTWIALCGKGLSIYVAHPSLTSTSTHYYGADGYFYDASSQVSSPTGGHRKWKYAATLYCRNSSNTNRKTYSITSFSSNGVGTTPRFYSNTETLLNSNEDLTLYLASLTTTYYQYAPQARSTTGYYWASIPGANYSSYIIASGGDSKFTSNTFKPFTASFYKSGAGIVSYSFDSSSALYTETTTSSTATYIFSSVSPTEMPYGSGSYYYISSSYTGTQAGNCRATYNLGLSWRTPTTTAYSTSASVQVTSSYSYTFSSLAAPFACHAWVWRTSMETYFVSYGSFSGGWISQTKDNYGMAIVNNTGVTLYVDLSNNGTSIKTGESIGWHRSSNYTTGSWTIKIVGAFGKNGSSYYSGGYWYITRTASSTAQAGDKRSTLNAHWALPSDTSQASATIGSTSGFTVAYGSSRTTGYSSSVRSHHAMTIALESEGIVNQAYVYNAGWTTYTGTGYVRIRNTASYTTVGSVFFYPSTTASASRSSALASGGVAAYNVSAQSLVAVGPVYNGGYASYWQYYISGGTATVPVTTYNAARVQTTTSYSANGASSTTTTYSKSKHSSFSQQATDSSWVYSFGSTSFTDLAIQNYISSAQMHFGLTTTGSPIGSSTNGGGWQAVSYENSTKTVGGGILVGVKSGSDTLWVGFYDVATASFKYQEILKAGGWARVNASISNGTCSLQLYIGPDYSKLNVGWFKDGWFYQTQRGYDGSPAIGDIRTRATCIRTDMGGTDSTFYQYTEAQYPYGNIRRLITVGARTAYCYSLSMSYTHQYYRATGWSNS